MTDCLFCRIVEGTIPAKIVRSDEALVAFEDIAPKAPVHTLIIPRRHIETLDDAVPADSDLLGSLMLAGAAIARERGIGGSGYRLVLNTRAGAGQTVFHVHLHLLGGRPMTWPPG